MKLVMLFPGQGSQAVGMGQALAEAHPTAMQTFEEAELITGMPLRQLCWEGPEEALRSTDNAQVALFVTSMAAYRVYRELGGPEATWMAGHSLGEYSALAASGALDFADALKIVRLRGQLMAKAEKGTMAAVLGFESDKLEAICQESPETVVIANYNSPDQLVISGTPAGVAYASEKAAEAGAKRVVPLSVAGAFHSPLMEVASADLTNALNQAPWQQADVAVLTNVDAQPTQDATAFAAKLSAQLASPVRWTDAMRWALDHGAEGFVELGAGRVLSGLVKKLNRKIPTFNVEDPETLDKTLSSLAAAPVASAATH
ncbi:Malonyl CoA-acyl carrier protein transacylase [compost metagenome]